MSPRQIELVRSTWARIWRSPEAYSRLFYERLFALDPALRALFRTDIRDQGQKLINMLQAAVDGVERPAELARACHALGRRHHYYGVREEDYQQVGSALLWMLERGLGTDFTPETAQAWRELYEMLADEMKSAARAEAAIAAHQPQ